METTPPNDDPGLDDLLRVRMSRALKTRLEDRARAEHRTASSHTRFLIERDLGMGGVSTTSPGPDTGVGNQEKAA